ncbi:nucleoside deaminase [Nakamurella flavida]|uniref:Nucleoside deaminase n=1 Tax=Nakamurella flavida TaxID=363630 RepID=A0A938YEM0_9ACTN|nr:nucleoside deaminase [Nakamurella flavida]MBM9476255.1 nucleoside deaminase [Nakamurella flavida]MDP9779647.1 tRNA(Arg) A34 adenosine deaminase TadA [Nakamurella flavida]
MSENAVPRPDLVARSVDLARRNVADGGKPFACLVVDATTGEVLQESTNQVVQSGDKTAHAEIAAIRALAAAGRTDLHGCDVYVTAYPCPMCLGALYYAEPEKVVFAATREQEGEHYEDGGRYMALATFYGEYAAAPADRALPGVQGEHPHPTAPFEDYAARHQD